MPSPDGEQPSLPQGYDSIMNLRTRRCRAGDGGGGGVEFLAIRLEILVVKKHLACMTLREV